MNFFYSGCMGMKIWHIPKGQMRRGRFINQLIPGHSAEPEEDGIGDSPDRRENAHWIMSTYTKCMFSSRPIAA